MEEQISDGDELRRHLHPAWLLDDGQISSAAFKDTEMSVDLCRLRSLQESCRARPTWGMAELSVSAVRGLNLDVVYKPVEDNPSHCEVPGKKTHAISKKLRDAARITYKPPA